MELRVCDAQTRIASVCAHADLTQSLVATFAAADEQLRVYEETGDVRAVAAWIAREAVRGLRSRIARRRATKGSERVALRARCQASLASAASMLAASFRSDARRTGAISASTSR